MFDKLKAFFSGRLNESGALPAIMAGAILISATGVLLAGFSVSLTKNAEVNSVKTNVNYYLNACEAVLEKETYKTFPSQFEDKAAVAGVSAAEVGAKTKIKDALTRGDCNSAVTSDGTSVVKIRAVGEPTLYIPTGETLATSVKVVLAVDISKGSYKSTGYSEVVKYLDYAERKDSILSQQSYIASFDENGSAVWVTPDT